MALQLTSAFVLFFSFFTATMAAYNVLSFGAKPDGHSDSAPAFLDAWSEACGDKEPATLVVPEGDFRVSQALFKGPCNNGDVQVLIKGNIVRNSGY
ncbi:polygalacturonase-like [Phalaenopsis equestris]|uniref:polygalacturonase-like n=1 Tax=Phalaenopsis equestris TaxID=78828 RepID=UPI0009E61F56|nr:polygalacturonase-like [Phalaenopsis equestris]